MGSFVSLVPSSARYNLSIDRSTAPSPSSTAPTGTDPGSTTDGPASQDPTGSSGSRGGRILLRQALTVEWRGLALGVTVALTWTVGRVATPYLVQRAIDDGIEQGGSLALWIAVLVAAGTLSSICTGLRRYLAFRSSRRVERWVRDRIFAHVQRLHIAFHDSIQTGDLMSRANTDLFHVQNLVTMVPVTVGNAVVVAAVTVLLFSANAQLALVGLAFLPLVNILGRRFSQRLHPALLAVQTESAELASVVEETVAGIRVVKGFGAEHLQARHLATEADDIYREALRASRVRSVYLPAVELLPNLGLVLVLWRGGELVLDGRLTVGQLVSFNIYLTMLIQPLRMLGQIIATLQRALTAGGRIHRILSTDPEIVDPVDPVHLPDAGSVGGIRFSGVRFSYPDEPDMPVLDGIDLDVEPGESVALVGATGSGKSTIARLLPRFYDVTAGSISLDGVDLRRIPLRELRRSVGIVFEETFLFTASVAENIAFADPDASRDLIERAARLAGAHDFIVGLEHGYDTRIGERGYSLSGGQRQRIAIARAIMASPRVVILDDATSAVDPTKEHEIRDALAEVTGRATTLVIAHRPATIALADRVVLIDDGAVVATGTHTDLLATVPRYREVLATVAAASPDGVPVTGQRSDGAAAGGVAADGTPADPERGGA